MKKKRAFIPDTQVDPAIKEWATDIECKYIDAVNEYGSQSKAADAIGVGRRVVDRAINRAKARAAKSGYSPPHDMQHTVPEGFQVKGVSTLYRDGEPQIQWVKSSVDAEQQAALMREAIVAMSEDIKQAKKTKAPKKTQSDLLNLYTITDYHLGMLAWGEETGADWDTKIAEDLLFNWFSTAVEQSPNSETAVFAQLGDFLHTDGLEVVTPANHNILDADSRFQKIVRVAIRVLRRVITLLLTKHKHVHVVMAEGNHDPASSIWLREWFAVLYENEPRVSVDLSPDPYYCYEHGQTSLFFHHGHKRKPGTIDDVFVAKFREVFGRTKHSYGHMGHLHNQQTSETNLMVVEQHRTLASPDAYASRGGWISGRDAKVITYDKQHGEVGRVVIKPEMATAA